jgi:hypothetical protein
MSLALYFTLKIYIEITMSAGKCAACHRNFLSRPSNMKTETETVTEFPLNVCQTVWTHIPQSTTISYDYCYFKTQNIPAVRGVSKKFGE